MADRIDDLAARVDELRADIAALRASLREEVRTRRVVIEREGFERVVISSENGFGQVAVFGRTGDADSTCVELFATDPVDGDGTHVGVAITETGEVTAAFELLEGRGARLWTDHDAPGE
jgi:hypothetical protein